MGPDFQSNFWVGLEWGSEIRAEIPNSGYYIDIKPSEAVMDLWQPASSFNFIFFYFFSTKIFSRVFYYFFLNSYLYNVPLQYNILLTRYDFDFGILAGNWKLKIPKLH